MKEIGVLQGPMNATSRTRASPETSPEESFHSSWNQNLCLKMRQGAENPPASMAGLDDLQLHRSKTKSMAGYPPPFTSNEPLASNHLWPQKLGAPLLNTQQPGATEGNRKDCTLLFSGLLLPITPTPASSFSVGPHSPSLTYIECDGVANELGVLLHHLFDTLLLQVLCLVLLQIQDHFLWSPFQWAHLQCGERNISIPGHSIKGQKASGTSSLSLNTTQYLTLTSIPDNTAQL